MKNKIFENISDEFIDKKLTIELGESVAENKHGSFGSVLLGALLSRKTSKNKKSKSISYKDESKALKHYKDLLDQGIITQEEFDIKKKLLDLDSKK